MLHCTSGSCTCTSPKNFESEYIWNRVYIWLNFYDHIKFYRHFCICFKPSTMGYGIYTSLIIVIFDILLNAGQLICNTLRSEYFFFNKVIPVILLCLYTRATSHEFHNSKWTHLPWKKKINANNNSNILYSYLYCVDGSKWGFYWIGRGWNKFIWCSTCGLQAYWFGGGDISFYA